MQEAREEALPVSWVEADGWCFESVPGTQWIIGTPDPAGGVWVMGADPEECRREWERRYGSGKSQCPCRWMHVRRRL